MKNKTILLIIGIMLVPNMVSAAWWNPFTWGNKKSVPNPTQQVQISTTTPKQAPAISSQAQKKPTTPTPQPTTQNYAAGYYRDLMSLYKIEIDFLSKVLDSFQPYKTNYRIENFIKLTSLRQERLAKLYNLVADMSEVSKDEMQAKKTWENGKSYLDTDNKTYNQSLENIQSYISSLSSKKSTPTQTSNSVKYTTPSYNDQPIPIPKGYSNCTSIPGTTMCGDAYFDPNNYTITISEASDGSKLYKVVPPPGFKFPGLGYFPSQEAAIESYDTWLKNNGY